MYLNKRKSIRERDGLVVACRLNKKNIIYLQRFGLLDGRNGRLKSGRSVSVNRLINQCLTIVLESEKNPYSNIATADELVLAWKKFLIGINNREIERLSILNAAISGLNPDEAIHLVK